MKSNKTRLVHKAMFVVLFLILLLAVTISTAPVTCDTDMILTLNLSDSYDFSGGSIPDIAYSASGVLEIYNGALMDYNTTPLDDINCIGGRSDFPAVSEVDNLVSGELDAGRTYILKTAEDYLVKFEILGEYPGNNLTINYTYLENTAETCFSACQAPTNLSCNGLDNSACTAEVGICLWDVDDQCILDCMQYDEDLGGNESICMNAFGGGSCDWFNDPNDDEGFLCDPVGFIDGTGGECWECHAACGMEPSCHADCDALDFCSDSSMMFSNCYINDGDAAGCQAEDDCVWMSDPSCTNSDEPCYDSVEPGWCNPNAMDFSGASTCIQYDGDFEGCKNAINFGTPCDWSPDWNGPLVSGTEHGWCNSMMGGGMGCWDYYDEEGCNSSADMGMPCEWETNNIGSSGGFCEGKQCWHFDFTNGTICEGNIGCVWTEAMQLCDPLDCWSLDTESACDSASVDYNVECSWTNYSYGEGGWCEESGCWERDWTNSSYCIAQDGCNWNDPWCDKKDCWEYDTEGEANCTAAAGLNCEWKTDSWGWCEQNGCWSYDGTNASECENTSAEFGMNCAWEDSNNICYENFQGCTDHDGDEFGCYGTGWCFWDPGTQECDEPMMGPMDFFNPGCWVFDQAGEEKCDNVNACTWSAGTSTCDDAGADANNGVQCANITDSEMCNNIPMLATCCAWGDTGCEDAFYTTQCWDQMQEPPVGAYFCDDYNAHAMFLERLNK